MKKTTIVILFILVTIVLFSQTKTTYKYLFLSHTYMDESHVDSRISQLNKSIYDNIWLGGDICSETLLHYSNLAYLQETLGIRNTHNYWTLGNHDRRNGNIEWLEQYLGHKTYYADYNNGITAFVFDTNLDASDCENLDKQYQLLCNVTDTITESSHLLLFFHWGIWNDVPGLPDPSTYAHTSLKYWNSNCDSTNNNFGSIIYPKLVEVKNRGVEVVCIIGDMGKYKKTTNMVSTDGINFIGCGLYNIIYRWQPAKWWCEEKDMVLLFNHNIETKTLTWSFQDIDSLLDVQNNFTYIEKLTFNNPADYNSANIEFIEYDNYMYKLFSDDSIIVKDMLASNILSQNNNLYFTGVFKTEVSSPGNNLKVVYQLKNGNQIVEEIERSATDLSEELYYFQDTIFFNTPINSVERLCVYVKSENSNTIWMNDLIVKYKNQTKD